jgi:hypothetical protein
MEIFPIESQLFEPGSPFLCQDVLNVRDIAFHTKNLFANPMRHLIVINDIFHIIYDKALGIFRPIRAAKVNLATIIFFLTIWFYGCFKTKPVTFPGI